MFKRCINIPVYQHTMNFTEIRVYIDKPKSWNHEYNLEKFGSFSKNRENMEIIYGIKYVLHFKSFTSGNLM